MNWWTNDVFHTYYVIIYVYIDVNVSELGTIGLWNWTAMLPSSIIHSAWRLFGVLVSSHAPSASETSQVISPYHLPRLHPFWRDQYLQGPNHNLITSEKIRVLDLTPYLKWRIVKNRNLSIQKNAITSTTSTNIATTPSSHPIGLKMCTRNTSTNLLISTTIKPPSI